MNILFSRPGYLWFLFLIPLLIAVHFISLKIRKEGAIKFANFEAISRIKNIDLYSKNIVMLVFSVLIILCLTLGLSGLTIQRTLQSSDFSFVIAIDNSQSMQANDVTPTRLEAAKEISKTFVQNSKLGTSIAVVSFSGGAVVQQTLTSDKSQLISSIDGIDLSDVGGTDVYPVVMAAANLLSSEPNKAIILLSDGQLNVGNISDSVSYAIKNGILIHTIAVGTEEGGSTQYGVSKLDEESLKALAFNTNGKFFSAADRVQLENSFSEISSMKFKDVNLLLSDYLFIASIILFFIYYSLGNLRYKTLP